MALHITEANSALNLLEDAGYEVYDYDNMTQRAEVGHPFGPVDDRDVDDMIDIIEESVYVYVVSSKLQRGIAVLSLAEKSSGMRVPPYGNRAPGIPHSYY